MVLQSLNKAVSLFYLPNSFLLVPNVIVLINQEHLRVLVSLCYVIK